MCFDLDVVHVDALVARAREHIGVAIDRAMVELRGGGGRERRRRGRGGGRGGGGGGGSTCTHSHQTR